MRVDYAYVVDGVQQDFHQRFNHVGNLETLEIHISNVIVTFIGLSRK